MSELTYETEEVDQVLIFRLSGRLDANTSVNLDMELIKHIEQGQKRILLDFGQLDYLSSAGMRLLLSMTRRLSGEGGKLSICTINDDVMEIIKVAGFERILNIYPTETAALKNA